MFVDKTIICKECGREFIFSAQEQEFFKQKEFIDPKRCMACRKAKRQRTSREN